MERLSRSGRDPGQFARDLIAHLRQLLVTRATGEVPESFTMTATEPERLVDQAGRLGDAKLIGTIDALSAAIAAMREGDDPRFSLEVALMRVAQPRLDSSREALLRRIEQLEGGEGGSPPPVPAPAPTATTSEPESVPEPEPEPEPEPSGDVASETESPAPEGSASPATTVEIER